MRPNPLINLTRNGMHRTLSVHALRACRTLSLRRMPLRAGY